MAESVKSLLETVSFVRAVFDKRPNADSLLDDLQRLVQKGEPLLSPKKELGPRRTSHERRASRLASISLSLPTATVATGGPPVSASQILQNLPSAQILLRHLPTSITAFTPFIAPSPTPDLDKSLESWQQSAIALLQEAGPEWLSGLHSVADMWHVRSSLNTLLGQGQLEREIAAAMEKEWGKRIEAVWESKMKDVVRLVETKTREAVAKIQSSANENGKPRAGLHFSYTDNRYQSRDVRVHGIIVPTSAYTCSHSFGCSFQRLPLGSQETSGVADTCARRGFDFFGNRRARNPPRYAGSSAIFTGRLWTPSGDHAGKFSLVSSRRVGRGGKGGQGKDDRVRHDGWSSCDISLKAITFLDGSRRRIYHISL